MAKMHDISGMTDNSIVTIDMTVAVIHQGHLTELDYLSCHFTLKNYDEYYLRYRRAVDSHNRLNVNRIVFQNAFLLKYPDIKPYLPGKRQTDTFRVWE